MIWFARAHFQLFPFAQAFWGIFRITHSRLSRGVSFERACSVWFEAVDYCLKPWLVESCCHRLRGCHCPCCSLCRDSCPRQPRQRLCSFNQKSRYWFEASLEDQAHWTFVEARFCLRECCPELRSKAFGYHCGSMVTPRFWTRLSYQSHRGDLLTNCRVCPFILSGYPC